MRRGLRRSLGSALERFEIVRYVSDSNEFLCYCSLNSLSVHPSPKIYDAHIYDLTTLWQIMKSLVRQRLGALCCWWLTNRSTRLGVWPFQHNIFHTCLYVRSHIKLRKYR